MTKKEKEQFTSKKETKLFHKIYDDGYQTGYLDGYKKAINDMKKCLEDVECNIYLAERNNQSNLES